MPGGKDEPHNDAALTPLTHEARALYEGRVVPVRTLARLCGVSLRTLYNYVHKHQWRRRRSDVPRDPAKSARQKRRYRELKALRGAAPRGLKARDPDGQARALGLAERATALSGAALARALARQETEAKARILSIMTQALRALRAADGAKAKVKAKRTRGKERKVRRRPYQWRAIGEPPAWADRRE